MELRLLRTFRAVATTGSFTRAAADLGYVQSNVTAQIKSLEREVGAPLFERLGRRIVITDAGRRLVEYADRILRLADDARAELHALSAGDGDLVGTLRIGAAETLCAYRLPHVLRALADRHPRLRVVFRPAARTELLADLSAARLDAALLLEEPIAGTGLAVESLAVEPLRLVAAPDHKLAGATSVSPADLADQPLIQVEEGCAHREVFDRQLRAAGVAPPVLAEFVSLEAVKQCAVAGLGVAMLPAVAMAGELRRGDLVVLPWHPGTDAPALHTQAVRLARRAPTPALTALLDLARTQWSG
ncbi:LysR family transcriptional regulator [Actinocatenispora thailandica]|uniref:LysR family transcriptional regulator n=1 Tax=Actinocatenispora thailandica TaxID=227318 RepID=A0A7R7HZF5_9ACTN|nr:LysR family transcriptional regulator [Actinocatenispora thailandica]BCJ38287.1 LysR family transcriptional regulator [Actinocatenispora thailandica]